MVQYGPFRALRCQFLDERERTEARSVYARAQMIRVVPSAQTDLTGSYGAGGSVPELRSSVTHSPTSPFHPASAA